GLRARGFYAVGKLVGVERRHTQAAESIENIALSGRNAAGERNFQHPITVRLTPDATLPPPSDPSVASVPSIHPAYRARRSGPRPRPRWSQPAWRVCAAIAVFLSNIAMVNGPTPPGTGDSAPAISATSGWTSPTTIDPRFSNASRRFDPAA